MRQQFKDRFSSEAVSQVDGVWLGAGIKPMLLVKRCWCYCGDDTLSQAG